MPANYSDIAQEILDCVEFEKLGLNDVMDRVEAAAVQLATERFAYGKPNLSEIAKILKMNRTTLHMRLSKLRRLEVTSGEG